MARFLLTAAMLALLTAAPVAVAQTQSKTAAPCRPTANKPCPPVGPEKTITYDDPFKPDTKSRSRLNDDDGWNLPRIKLDNDTTLGIGGIERKF